MTAGARMGGLWLRRAEVVLLGAAAFATGWEALVQGQHLHTPEWYFPPALVVGGALLAVRRTADELRPAVVVGISALLYLGFFGVHRALGTPIHDIDINGLYPRYGHQFLDTGQLPIAEYPPGALLSFLAAAAVGRVDIALPLLMLPLLLAGWWAVASSRPRAAWIVAVVALWPTLQFFWEVKYDAIPTGLFLLGMAAAYRGRWGWAGLAFGLGAATKWWPILAAITLAAALVRRRELRSLAVLAVTTAIGPLLVYLPFLGAAELTPYRVQGTRDLTGESLPYLVLHLAAVVGRPRTAWVGTGASHATKVVTVGILLVVLALIVFAAWRVPRRALPLAATSVVAFFLLNRIFSAQFMLSIAAAWGCALVFAEEEPGARTERWFVVLLGVAATANWAVYPIETQHWILFEWAQFAAATAATLLVLGGIRTRRGPGPLAAVLAGERAPSAGRVQA